MVDMQPYREVFSSAQMTVLLVSRTHCHCAQLFYDPPKMCRVRTLTRKRASQAPVRTVASRTLSIFCRTFSNACMLFPAWRLDIDVRLQFVTRVLLA